MTRANPMIWRVAEWLYENFYEGPHWHYPLRHRRLSFKARYYDKAAELLKKISLNEFTTGEDNHGD